MKSDKLTNEEDKNQQQKTKKRITAAWVQGEGEEVWGAVQRERPPNTAFALFVLARVVVTKTLPKDWKGQSGRCKKPRL